MAAPFSVLMSVYGREREEFLRESLASLLAAHPAPAELVLVEDGPLSAALQRVIDEFRPRLALKSVRLPRNEGLPGALNAGLDQTCHELVARFDTDDLCEPSRFAQQLDFLALHPEVAAVGSWVEEFDTHSGAMLSLRSPPTGHADLVRYAKLRCPLNHPSVMFRKAAVLQVGGYEEDMSFEDYGLWLRLIIAGHKVANIPSVLVRMRAGSAQVQRRRGIDYVRREFIFVRKFYRNGFFSLLESAWYLLLHAPFRLLPNEALNVLYQRQLRTRASR